MDGYIGLKPQTFASLDGRYVNTTGDTMTGALTITPTADSTAILRVNNAANTVTNLIIDTINKRIGMGTSTPSFDLEVVADQSSCNLGITSYKTGGGNSGIFRWRTARGTQAVPLVVAQDDIVGLTTIQGYNGSSFQNCAAIWGYIDGANPSSTSMPGRLVFGTTPIGSNTASERMRIYNDGQIDFLNTASFDTEVNNGNSGTADTIDWTVGNKQKSTLTGNCIYTFTAPHGPCNLVLRVIQDATGSRTVTWPGTVKWPSGTAVTLSTGANAIDIVSFYFDGTNYYGVGNITFS